MNISAFELEPFVCELLRDSDDQSEIFQQVLNHWTEMDEVEQRTSLPKVICRVVYHHEASEITIELNDSYEA